jgi:hypothetical protein
MKAIGVFRMHGAHGRPDAAYVTDGRNAHFVPEASYRTQGYRPEYERLPWKDPNPADSLRGR